MLMAVCHEKGMGWSDVDDLDQLSDLREQAGKVLWAESDVNKLTAEDVKLIAEEFNLDELAVEDATSLRQRPKFERYENHLFVVFHQLEEEDRQFEVRQIACFIGDQYILTLHDAANATLDEAKTRLADGELESPAFLVYTILDAVVDDYQAKADTLEAEMEELEELVLAAPHAPVQRQLYAVKQRVARLRRYVFPGARLLAWVDEPVERRPFSEETANLFRDVHDHLLRMTDQIRNIDELADAVLELVRSEQANRLNEVNKRLAAWAAIFGVGTLIAGIYGMNFALVPRHETYFGFWFAIGLMFATSVGLYFFFKKREWL